MVAENIHFLIFISSQQLIQLLNSQPQAQPPSSEWEDPRGISLTTNNSFCTDYENDDQHREEQVGQQDGAEDITRQMQILGFGHSPSDPTASNNPFRNPQSRNPQSMTARSGSIPHSPGHSAELTNPFRNPTNYPSARRRAATPHPGQSSSNPYASGYQVAHGGLTAGYFAPQASPAYAMQSLAQHQLRTYTPAIGYGEAQQYDAAIRRPKTAQDHSSSRSSEHSLVAPTETQVA